MNRPERITVGFKQSMAMLGPYVKKRLLEQVQSVALIVVYLVLFQLLVLRLPIVDAGSIALGIGLVVLGLTFFMEGLLIGLMPLGEILGLQLPRKTKLPFILFFAFLLGVGATFAEPAIGVLRLAGSSVKPWQAPLLFYLLNEGTSLLVWAVAGGVGMAVLFGMLRFIYNWSLKPFLFVLVPILLVMTLLAFFDPNMRAITGLAWDTGGVTTGPVTVPLVLALGIGISRMSSKGDGGGGGFGVVTLASAFPIIMVLGLGAILNVAMPSPQNEAQFFDRAGREDLVQVFGSQELAERYVLNSANEEIAGAYYGSPAAYEARLAELDADSALAQRVLGAASGGGQESFGGLMARNGLGALQAILPLCGFMLIVLLVIVRERLPNPDEIFLGIFIAVLGMGLFGGGIELGLSNMGRQVGSNLPVLYQSLEDVQNQKLFRNFDPELVQRSVSPDGRIESFIYLREGSEISPIDFEEEAYDPEARTYTYTPVLGPLYPGEGLSAGLLLALLFAFIMGYAATLAEPALNALGRTVEELTAGVFKKSALMQAVAIGVAIGITIGLMKILWDIPLLFILGPSYLLLLIMTAFSSEDYVNIAWDSAGVTTGPVTVPLVLALGLGIGTQVGILEGFGILAAASVFPIMSVLTVGLVVSGKRKKKLSAQTA